MTKKDVRELAEKINLPTAKKEKILKDYVLLEKLNYLNFYHRNYQEKR